MHAGVREIACRAAQQRLDLLRREAIGRGEIGDRLLVLLLALIDQAAAVERRHVIGVERKRAIEFRECFLGLAGLGENLAARGVALRVAGVARADIVGRLLRELLRLFLIRAPRAQIERAAAERGGEGNREQRHGRSNEPRSAGKNFANRHGHMAE